MKENIYRTARKKAAQENPLLNSLETAQDLLCIDRLRLLKIENGQKCPNPDDIAAMAEVYNAPELRNYYCTKECPLGCDEQPLIYDDLDKISVRLMSALHFLENANDRIFTILEDGQISDNEREEFSKILETLDKISYSAGSLELWAKKNGFEE
ncbi:MAG: helix-turn-helix transcriptional regulator [Clostridia bacterium]|nr:helix-turn-helix transcriptional regulator [Oscillospiraceae bacterium]MBQ7005855.1 helix-turn-helix transcriptional regulator [Clostridia bacterium]